MEHAATLRALEAMGISPAISETLARAAGPPRNLMPGERLVEEGEAAVGLWLLVSGVAKACHNLKDGGVQTLALYGAGEILDSLAYVTGRATVTVAAVTSCRACEIPGARLEAVMDANSSTMRALWRATAREAAILQEWVVGMGRRSAHSQIAHLICEIVVRLRLGAPSARVHDFPLTQADLAEVAGLSAVHVNRIVQGLRAEGLIELGRGWLRIRDWDRLVEVADFDPDYLSLGGQGPSPRQEPRPVPVVAARAPA